MSRVSGLAERVRLMILRGELPAGGRIVELHLAEAFDVSRSTVREVVRLLEGRGLLEANGNGGMRVVRLERDDMVAALEVRGALEALSARLAAGRVKDGRATPEALRGLDALADAADFALRSAGPDAAVLADRAMHRAIDALAASPACREALDRTWDRIIVAALQTPARSHRAAIADVEHRELLVAIAAGDGDEAAALAHRHVLADAYFASDG